MRTKRPLGPLEKLGRWWDSICWDEVVEHVILGALTLAVMAAVLFATLAGCMATVIQ